MNKLLRYIFLGILFLSLPTSSGWAGPENSIIGKWANEAKLDDTFEFLKDGTVIMEQDGHRFVGNYRFISDNRLKLDFGKAGIIMYETEISGSFFIKDTHGLIMKLIPEKLAQKRREATTSWIGQLIHPSGENDQLELKITFVAQGFFEGLFQNVTRRWAGRVKGKVKESGRIEWPKDWPYQIESKTEDEMRGYFIEPDGNKNKFTLSRVK